MRLPRTDRARRPPGPASSGWLNAARYLQDPLSFWTNLGRTYGDVAFVRLGPWDCYLLNSPELIKDALVTESRKLMRSPVYEEGKRILGDGLGTSDGELHDRQRRLIQPLFSKSAVASYADVMVEAAMRARETWGVGRVINAFEEMSRATLEALGKSLFGEQIRAETAKSVHALAASSAVLHRFLFPFSGILWKLPLPATRRLERARIDLDRLIYRGIEDRRDSRAGGGGDLLSLLVAAHDASNGGASPDGNRQIRDEAVAILVPGSETTALALTWTWYLLSQHRSVEAKLHHEVDGVLGSRLPQAVDVEQLPYTRMVFREAMRLYPPAWTVARRVQTEYRVGTYVARPGTILVVSQWVTHRDPRFFPDPLSFRPERWDAEGPDRPPQFGYFPFGGGVRRCIGERFAWMQGVLLLATLAQRWQLRLVPGCEPLPKAIATLRPRHDVRMTVLPRATGS